MACNSSSASCHWPACPSPSGLKRSSQKLLRHLVHAYVLLAVWTQKFQSCWAKAWLNSFNYTKVWLTQKWPADAGVEHYVISHVLRVWSMFIYVLYILVDFHLPGFRPLAFSHALMAALQETRSVVGLSKSNLTSLAKRRGGNRD